MVRNTTVILIIIAIFLFTLLIIGIYGLGKKGERGSTLFLCDPGSCPTNIITGVKRCPTDQKAIEAYREFEVCNQPNSCDGLTPFAIRADLSTNSDGVCEKGVNCRCSVKRMCPYYISNIFTPTNGNPYDTSSSFYYRQSLYKPQDDAGNSFCSIPLISAPRAFPSCLFNPSDWKNSFINCANEQAACQTGQLVVIPEDPDHYDESRLTFYNIGCVNGPLQFCQGKVPLYNKYTGQINCV